MNTKNEIAHAIKWLAYHQGATPPMENQFIQANANDTLAR